MADTDQLWCVQCGGTVTSGNRCDSCKAGDASSIPVMDFVVQTMAELIAERDALKARAISAERLCSVRGDQAGALRTENDELLRENARLRRANERLERERARWRK